MPFEARRASFEVSGRIRSSSPSGMESCTLLRVSWYTGHAIGQSYKKCMKYVYGYVLAFMLRQRFLRELYMHWGKYITARNIRIPMYLEGFWYKAI